MKKKILVAFIVVTALLSSGTYAYFGGPQEGRFPPTQNRSVSICFDTVAGNLHESQNIVLRSGPPACCCGPIGQPWPPLYY